MYHLLRFITVYLIILVLSIACMQLLLWAACPNKLLLLLLLRKMISIVWGPVLQMTILTVVRGLVT
jgi:hypothetical protein